MATPAGGGPKSDLYTKIFVVNNVYLYLQMATWLVVSLIANECRSSGRQQQPYLRASAVVSLDFGAK